MLEDRPYIIFLKFIRLALLRGLEPQVTEKPRRTNRNVRSYPNRNVIVLTVRSYPHSSTDIFDRPVYNSNFHTQFFCLSETLSREMEERMKITDDDDQGNFI